MEASLSGVEWFQERSNGDADENEVVVLLSLFSGVDGVRTSNSDGERTTGQEERRMGDGMTMNGKLVP
jgi:hypothetical protein